MAIDLLTRAEAGAPLTQSQHDTNFTAIQTAFNTLETTVGALAPTPGANKTANYTLAASDANALIVCTAAITVTVPSAGTLGSTFACSVLADGAAVTLNGPGATNVTLASGEIGSVFVANSKVWASKGTATRID